MTTVNNANTAAIYDFPTQSNAADSPSDSDIKNAILNLGGSGSYAKGIGGALDTAEQGYLKAMQGNDTKAQATWKLKYEKAMQAFQAFMQMTSNSFQMMLSIIRNISVR